MEICKHKEEKPCVPKEQCASSEKTPELLAHPNSQRAAQQTWSFVQNLKNIFVHRLYGTKLTKVRMRWDFIRGHGIGEAGQTVAIPNPKVSELEGLMGADGTTPSPRLNARKSGGT